MEHFDTLHLTALYSLFRGSVQLMLLITGISVLFQYVSGRIHKSPITITQCVIAWIGFLNTHLRLMPCFCISMFLTTGFSFALRFADPMDHATFYITATVTAFSCILSFRMIVLALTFTGRGTGPGTGSAAQLTNTGIAYAPHAGAHQVNREMNHG